MNAQDYVFLLDPEETASIVTDWPLDMWLAVVRRVGGDTSFAIFHADERSEALARVAEGLPVFPRTEGYPTVRITFEEESRVLALISKQDDLVELAAARQSDLAWGGLPAVPTDTENADGAVDAAAIEGPSRMPENDISWTRDGALFAPPVATAEVAVTLERVPDGAVFRIGRSIAAAAGLTDGADLLLDGARRRAAFVPGGVVPPTVDDDGRTVVVVALDALRHVPEDGPQPLATFFLDDGTLAVELPAPPVPPPPSPADAAVTPPVGRVRPFLLGALLGALCGILIGASVAALMTGGGRQATTDAPPARPIVRPVPHPPPSTDPDIERMKRSVFPDAPPVERPAG